MDAPKHTPTPRLLSCDDLASVVEGTNLDVAVLVGLHPYGNEPRGIQFVTYGRAPQDEDEAHQLKEWIKEDAFGGEVPEATIHQSSVLNERDQLRATNAELLAAAKVADEWLRILAPQMVGRAGFSITALNLDIAALQDAIAKAEGQTNQHGG